LPGYDWGFTSFGRHWLKAKDNRQGAPIATVERVQLVQ